MHWSYCVAPRKSPSWLWPSVDKSLLFVLFSAKDIVRAIAIAMGSSNSGKGVGVKVGGTATIFLCSALMLWAYDRESWLLHTTTLFTNNQLRSSTSWAQSNRTSSFVMEDVRETKPPDNVDNQINHSEIVNHTNFRSGLSLEQTNTSEVAKQCDIFTGAWVYDESYVLHSPGQCPYSSPGFNCQKNGRKDSKYQKWRWQPRDCDIPRFNASEVLEKLRGKRMVYVGDSISRSQWESMLCLLSSAVAEGDASLIHSHAGRTVAYVIKSCNCSVELSWAPFLVRQREIPATNATSPKETLQIDRMDEQASVWKSAHVLLFNTGHWWTHPQPFTGNDYYEEGGFIYPHMEEAVAFEKAMKTWAKWVDSNINPLHTQVLFEGYSPVHFNGKMWGKSEAGGCFKETEPITKLDEEEARRNPDMKRVWTVGNVIEEMKIKVKLVNITWMSMHRKDAHSSVYSGRTESDSDYTKADCSHWCLPGLPDVWNHLLSVLII